MNPFNISDLMRKVHNHRSCVAGMFFSFLGVFNVQFSATVQHHDKHYEFQLGFVKHGTESQGSCQSAFQATSIGRYPNRFPFFLNQIPE